MGDQYPVWAAPAGGAERGTVVTPLGEAWFAGEPGRPRRRTGLWIGVGLGVVAIVGAGVAGWVLVGSKLFPARSPEAAVERLVDGIAGKDPLAVYGALSPSEVSLFRAGFEGLDDLGPRPTADPKAQQAWEDALESISITIDGVELESTPIGDGLAKVAVTGGSVTIDGDPEAITDAVVEAMKSMLAEADPSATAWLDDPAERDSAVAEIADALPFTASPADEWRVRGEAPYVVAVHEGRGWYVSPLMTLGEYLIAELGLARGEMSDGEDAPRYDTPEEAAEGATDALAGLILGDAAGLTDTLARAESRFVAVYLEPMLAEADPEDLGFDAIEVTSAEFEVLESDGDRAALGVTDLAVEMTIEGETASIHFDGDCLSVDGPAPAGTEAMCMSDVPLYAELGIDTTMFVAVRDGGGWRVSLVASTAQRLVASVRALASLAADGRLYDEAWLEEQTAGLDGTWADPTGDGPYFYGDDPYLDGLWDACEAGDAAACDQLYWESPEGSDYEWYGGTCALLGDPALAGGTCVEQQTLAG